MCIYCDFLIINSQEFLYTVRFSTKQSYTCNPRLLNTHLDNVTHVCSALRLVYDLCTSCLLVYVLLGLRGHALSLLL